MPNCQNEPDEAEGDADQGEIRVCERNRQQDAEKLLQLGVDDLITDKPEIIAPLLARDKALDNRLLWLRDQIQELFAVPDTEETMEVEETIEDAIEDPEEVLDEA